MNRSFSASITRRSVGPIVLVLGWALVASGCGLLGGVHVVTLHDPLSPDEHVALGVAYERDGKLDRASEEYKSALRAQPDNVQALVNLGNLAANAGADADAEAWYARAVRNGGPLAASGANNLAWLYLTQGKRLASAESLARKALAWDPRPEYLDTLVDVLLKLGKPLDASRAIDDGLTQWRDDAQALAKVREMVADDHQEIARQAFDQGKAKLAAGRYDEAERLIREAVRRDTEHTADYPILLAQALLESGRVEDAVRVIDEARTGSAATTEFAAKARAFAQTAHARSQKLFQEGAVEPAESLVRGALRWDPDRAPYYLDTLAQVLIAREKPYEAGKVIDEAEGLAPAGDAELRARLFDRKAELFTSKGLAAEAKAAAQQADAIRKAATP